jgi:hypothetical protein
VENRMLAKRRKLILILTTIGIVTFVVSYILTSAQISAVAQVFEQVEPPIPTFPVLDAQRTFKDGFEVIEESELVSMARTALDVREITEEKITYLKAGQWARTRMDLVYRTDPDHPIFYYRVRGTVGGQLFALGACGSDPNAKCEYVETWDAGTVAIDAVTGQLFYWANMYISDADLALQIFTTDHNVFLTQLAEIEATASFGLSPMPTLPLEIIVTSTMPPPESTVDITAVSTAVVPDSVLPLP